MGFQQGLSGLSAASAQLSAISNNVANASTVGFKSSSAQFADLYSSSVYGSASLSLGNGSQISSVAQKFTSGNITPTGNNLDLAINNNGFFVVRLGADTAAGTPSSQNSTAVAYTRNGQFSVDSTGYLVSGTSRLQGWPANNGVITQGPVGDLQVQATLSSPQASTKANMSVNLNSSSTVPAISPINPAQPTSFNWSNSATIFDSLGNQHSMTMYYALNSQSAAGSQWTVATYVDGVAAPAGANTTTLKFDTKGVLTNVGAGGPAQTINVTYLPTNGSTSPEAITLSLAGSTQVAQGFATPTLTVDGYAPGTLTGLTISADGTIQAGFSNGQSQKLGQIALATFTNAQGLQNLGGNVWQQTPGSGQAALNVPGSGVAGTIQSGALEQSNVDLTGELVNMITAQRFYQANAQSIKTQDTILQSIMNLA